MKDYRTVRTATLTGDGSCSVADTATGDACGTVAAMYNGWELTGQWYGYNAGNEWVGTFQSRDDAIEAVYDDWLRQQSDRSCSHDSL